MDKNSKNINDFTCSTWLTSGNWTFKLTKELKQEFREETRQPKRSFRKATHDEVYYAGIEAARQAILNLKYKQTFYGTSD